MDYRSLNGERIAFRRSGSGDPVLLLHSLGTHSGLWKATQDALANRYTTIAFDCRGHGASTLNGTFSVEAIASDALTLMEELGFERYHVVGSSMGGLFAVALNARQPQRLMSLTMVGGYASAGPAGPPRLAATRELLQHTSMRRFAESYTADTLMPTADLAARDFLVEAIASMQPSAYLATLEEILLADVSPLLGQIKVPALMIAGNEDRRAPVIVSQMLEQAIAGAKLKVLPKAGHLPMLDDPTQFCETLTHFLNCESVGCNRKP
ncbi:MAG TPA: alpha/beta fold hydrolase [Beijerinckiaceae bacterium]|jgi:3-oxoadipate enol-lactonase|nr:alpha/beta fold hydrolase [Beijerinckiaceae bacterium]